LLQALAGIIAPSAGSIEVFGRVSSLLTLGAGFDQELTGRENVLLAGAFMGIEQVDMARLLEPIVSFADIGDFIDAPIKTYSTGMRARLGFVLATGDQVFRAKSRQRVLDIVEEAKAVVLVTHDMSWVTEFCNRAMLLEKGHVVAAGNPADIVAIHQERSERARQEREAAVAAAGGGRQLP
jgi:ABC-type polysaccharide/polyol phosphate transport system ATPase subunit